MKYTLIITVEADVPDLKVEQVLQDARLEAKDVIHYWLPGTNVETKIVRSDDS